MNLQELIHLIYENNIPELKKYKDSGIDFSIFDSYTKGNLLLSYSIYGYEEHYTQTEMVEFLLESGIDINYQPNGRDNGKSALHNAVGKGHLEIVKALINNGANLDAKDKNGNTPLWNCVMMCRGNEKQIEIIKYLISKGSSLDLKNNHEMSPRDIINDIGLGIDKGNNQKEWDLRFLLS
jgi:ankyrin repeat protein